MTTPTNNAVTKEADSSKTAELLATIEALKGALEFYATQWNQGSDYRIEPSDVLFDDEGDKARAALESIKTKEKP